MVTRIHYNRTPPLPITSRQAHHNPALREARATWTAYPQQTETHTTASSDKKFPEQNKKHPNQENKPYHTKASPKNKRKHANRRRQMFFNSSHQPPTPVPTRNPPRLDTLNPQSTTSQQNPQNESKTKGGGGKQRQNLLQHKSTNIPPITQIPSCPLCCPISHTEANHRHILTEFADWIKIKQQAPPPTTSPTTYRYVTPTIRTSNDYYPDPNAKSSRRKRLTFSHPGDTSTSYRSQQKHLHQPRPTDMPTDTITNACYLGSDMPIRPRNPHTRGTTKYTKRQNINRNVRLHLRNDRKLVQNDLMLNKTVHDAHFLFYCTLSSLNTWHHTRQLLPHDRTLIRQWTALYRQGKNTVLKLRLMPNTQQATQMMTRLLVQHVKHTLTIAETGTLVRRPLSLTYSWHTPLNSQRIEHFCTHLHNLILEPFTTPDFQEPHLDVARFQVYGDIVTDILAEVEEKLSASN
jgi:hypothetical protein